MPRGENTGMVKKAKRAHKMAKMAEAFPERAAEFEQRRILLVHELKAAGVCLYCGRSITSEAAREIGLGLDCYSRLSEDGTLDEWMAALTEGE